MVTTDPLVNRQIKQYLIKERLEIGGMSVIYKALDTKYDRMVAFKILRENFIDEPQIIARFQQEAKITEQLAHPNIIPFYDYGERDGMLYMVIKLMALGSLHDRIKKNPAVPVHQALHWLEQISAALDFAHLRHVVHRDLKPGNFLMANENDVYLGDFGIARILEGTSLTLTGQAMPGTVRYMSPEQIKADRKLKHYSDIYSFGIIAYLLLTGHYPFTGRTVLVMMNQHLMEQPPYPNEVNKTLPSAVNEPLLQCLEKEPRMRYKNTRSFIQDLNSVLGGHLDVVVRVEPRSPNPLGRTSKRLSPLQFSTTTTPLRDVRKLIADFNEAVKQKNVKTAGELLEDIQDMYDMPTDFDIEEASTRLGSR